MARRPRSLLPDGLYHLIARGVDGCAIVRDDDDRRSWLALLAAVTVGWRWEVYAFCLMNTHYHVVARARIRDLSGGMHRLNGVHAEAINQKYGRTGDLFGDRFTSWLIEDEEYLAAACLHIVANPVRAGSSDFVGDWPWAANRFAFAD